MSGHNHVILGGPVVEGCVCEHCAMSDHTPPTDKELAEMQALCDGPIPRERTTNFRTGLEITGADLIYTCSLRIRLDRLIVEVKRQRKIIRLDWEAKTKQLIDDSEASGRLDADDYNLRVGESSE